LLAVSTKPRGLLEAVRAPIPYYYFLRAEQMGMRYARVLPEPVGEVMWWIEAGCFEREASRAYWTKVGVWIEEASR
jgi:hypothetical protein